jgi:hypothetical protein
MPKPKISFKEVLDKRFMGKMLKEATIKGKTDVGKIRKIGQALADGYITDKKNKGVTIGIAYHYKHMKWLPALMTDLSNRKLHDGVPLFVETDSGREMEEKLTDDHIDEIRIYVLENDSRDKDTKSKMTVRTPIIKKGVGRSIFNKK